MVEVSTLKAEDPKCESRLRLEFSRLNHSSDLKIDTPVATLPGAWPYRVSAGTVWPGASILWLGEMESFICSFYLSVAACKIVWADLSLRYTSMFAGRLSKQPTNKPLFSTALYGACAWLSNVPATGKVYLTHGPVQTISDVLPHWYRSSRSNLISHPVTVCRHWANKS